MKPVALDPAFIQSLYEELAPRLKRRADVPPDVAEDLVQEAFLRLLTRAPNHLGNLRGWVYRVFCNLVRDHYRTSTRRDDSLAENLPQGENFEVTETEQEIAGWLRRFLTQLPPAYGEAVRLADFEGASMKEIARVLGMSVSGAKSRVQRGRAKLYDRLISCCRVILDENGRAVGYLRRNEVTCPTS